MASEHFSNIESIESSSYVAIDSADPDRPGPGEYMTFFPTFMNILSTLTGVEVMSVSNSMTFCGFVYSIAMMVFTTILSYIGTIVVITMQKRVRAESINDLATKIVGKWGGQAYSTLTLCFTYSCQVAYLIVGAKSVVNWIGMLGYTEWTVGYRRSLVVLGYALVIPVALSIPRDLEILSTVSTAAIGCQVLYISTMIYEAIKMLPKQGIHITVESGTMGMQFFNAFAIYSMLYAFPSVVLPLLRCYPPDMKKRYFLIGASFVACFSVTIIPGSIGYLIWGTETNEIVINSFDPHDPYVQAVNIAFFLVVNASFAVVSITVMTDISGIVFRSHQPAKLPFTKRLIALIISDAPPVLVAMILPNVRPAFEVGGAFGGCLSNFFVPPLLWILQSDYKWYHWTNILMLLFSLFGLVSAAIATYQAVEEAIAG